MGYIAIAIAIFLFAMLLGFSGARGQSKSDGTKTTILSFTRIKSSGQGDLRQKLTALPKSTVPIELAKGAMCYKPAPPKSAEYCCPKCGEKTLYSLKTIS